MFERSEYEVSLGWCHFHQKLVNGINDECDDFAGNPDKYCITVSKPQLILIARTLEDISRFAAGQEGLDNTLASLIDGAEMGHNEINEIYLHLKSIKDIIYKGKLDGDEYFGYDGSEEQTPSQKALTGNLYQIYREILHFVAEEEHWDNTYNSQTLPSGNMGRIKIEKID